MCYVRLPFRCSPLITAARYYVGASRGVTGSTPGKVYYILSAEKRLTNSQLVMTSTEKCSTLGQGYIYPRIDSESKILQTFTFTLALINFSII